MRQHNEVASLASGLFWDATTRVMMLVAYCGESGEQLSLGGCTATGEVWKAFSSEWRAALPLGMDIFHITDFEARRDLCADWNRSRRNEFLNGLLDIMGRHIIQFYGVRLEGEGYREGVLNDIIIEISGCEEKIALVFSDQSQCSLSNIERVLGEIDHQDRRLVSATLADPRAVNPLQAADIIAFETMRYRRNVEARHPLLLEWTLRSASEKTMKPTLRLTGRES